MKETIELTIEQINAVMLNRRIIGTHSICNDKLIVCCSDGYLRMIEFNERGKIVWLDND